MNHGRLQHVPADVSALAEIRMAKYLEPSDFSYLTIHLSKHMNKHRKASVAPSNKRRKERFEADLYLSTLFSV